MICVLLVDVGMDHRILSVDRGWKSIPHDSTRSSGGILWYQPSFFSRSKETRSTASDAIADIDGVSEVYSIAGRYDLAAIIRVKTNDDMAKVVTERIRKVGGITSSETLISFRVYSRHDLERMFSIGMEHP